jgi:hypothetical protein
MLAGYSVTAHYRGFDGFEILLWEMEAWELEAWVLEAWVLEARA